MPPVTTGAVSYSEMSEQPGNSSPANAGGARTKVLCVDDQPSILKMLAASLRQRYDVLVAASGAEALEVLAGDTSIGVVVSDMRMPEMDGVAFLSRARQLVPDATRILLTGQADLESATAAVNEGEVFRFLTKPCPAEALLKAVAAAADHYRLITSERVLLEETLHGSITALTDVLALTSPLAFGRASRIKQIVSEVAEVLAMPERWQVEVAAMLSQLGCITLPAETAEKVYYGRLLTIDEQRMIANLPIITEQLLRRIPRLEVVRGMLMASARPAAAAGAGGGDASQQLIARGAGMLRAAIDFDTLDVQAHSPSAALKTMRGRTGRYEAAVLDALEAVRGAFREPGEARDVALADLEVGMVFVEDVKLDTGALLAARGYEVTAGFVARAENFRHALASATVRVIGPKPS